GEQGADRLGGDPRQQAGRRAWCVHHGARREGRRGWLAEALRVLRHNREGGGGEPSRHRPAQGFRDHQLQHRGGCQDLHRIHARDRLHGQEAGGYHGQVQAEAGCEH
ncbi:unnamed protein product, partial [Ectocarpus sp. 12 AP-2014]